MSDNNEGKQAYLKDAFTSPLHLDLHLPELIDLLPLPPRPMCFALELLFAHRWSPLNQPENVNRTQVNSKPMADLGEVERLRDCRTSEAIAIGNAGKLQ